jgi:hypothetical protein
MDPNVRAAYVTAFLAVAGSLGGVIYTTFAQRDIAAAGPIGEKQLSVAPGMPSDPLIVALAQPYPFTVTFKMDGKEMTNLRVVHSTITNVGRSPIEVADTFKPLSVSVSSPWQLLAVVNSQATTQQSISPTWTRVDDRTMAFEPLLINPGDHIDVDVFATDPQASSDKALDNPEMKWDARIRGMRSLIIAEDSFLTFLNRPRPEVFPYIQIMQESPGVLFTLIVGPLGQALYILLLHALNLLRPNLATLALLVGTAFVSYCAAESYATYIFPTVLTAMSGVGNINLLFPYLQLLSFGLLMYVLWRRRKRRVSEDSASQGG